MSQSNPSGFRRGIVAALPLALSGYGSPAFAVPTFFGTTPSSSVVDSPFAGHTFTSFYLEDFGQ
ncbi:MAG: hypothetical protein NNA22_10300 [Nitrospira sp.]|nr:hypothetical protein [Nitrospira sp.]